MANTRVRCSSCRQYVDRNECVRKAGLSWVCSSECMTQLMGRPRKPRNVVAKKPRDRQKDRKAFEQRDFVRKRDGQRCRRCGSSRWLHVHHITYRGDGGPGIDDPVNLITLCDRCHTYVHSQNKRYWQMVLRYVIWTTYAGFHITATQAEHSMGAWARAELGITTDVKTMHGG